MFKLKKDYKIPYINRVIPAKTLVFALGGFKNPEDSKRVKVRIERLGTHNNDRPVPKIGEVYGIDEDLLELNK